MLSNLNKFIHSAYSDDWAKDGENFDKQHRINKIFKVVKVDKLLNKFGQFIFKSIAKEKKCEKEAKCLLKCTSYLYLSESYLEESIDKLNLVNYCQYSDYY